MSLQLDHVVIAVADLEAAIADYRELGFTVLPGGVHANRATHNALVIFSDGTYLELLAATGERPAPGLIDFGRMLSGGEGLAGYALRTENIEAERARLRAAGFDVGEVIPGERQTADHLVRWKLALIEDGFAPFLIQDVTPRAWRVPAEPTLIAHANRAVGLREVVIAVRALEPAWERYTRLFEVTPSPGFASMRRDLPGLVLYQHRLHYSTRPYEPYGRLLSPEDLAQVDASQEPRSFATAREIDADRRAEHATWAETELAMAAALADGAEALFSIHLVREQSGDGGFALERTHGARFRHHLGVAPTRGMDILAGLDDVDWSAVEHAYGPATDVPSLLRALTSDDEAVREYAHEVLSGSIVHQGDVYEASITAVPFLARLLVAPDVDKYVPKVLLSSIAFAGLATPELEAQTRQTLQAVLPLLLDHLTHPDPDVREGIVDLLRLYPHEAGRLTPLLREQSEHDPVPYVRAKCLHSLATLWKGDDDLNAARKLAEAQQAYFAGRMHDPAQPMALRFAAALILTRDDQDAWWRETAALFQQIMSSDEGLLGSFGENFYPALTSIFYGALAALPDHLDALTDGVLVQARHVHPVVREYAARALSELVRVGQPVAPMLPALRELLHDPSPDVREWAIHACDDLPDFDAVREVFLDLAAHDPSVTIRALARQRLNRPI